MENTNQSSSEILKKIQAIAFAKVETELYLDSHPECAYAIEYYKDLCEEYNTLVNVYEQTKAPLTHESAAVDEWLWVKGPWPWQNGEEV